MNIKNNGDFHRMKIWLLHIYHLLGFDVKQREFYYLKCCDKFFSSLLRYIRIIWKYHWSYHHKLPSRVRSVYFVDNKGHFEQMINGRISFMLSHSTTWSLCTIKTTFHSLSFCFFLTTKKKSSSHCFMHCLFCVVRC